MKQYKLIKKYPNSPDLGTVWKDVDKTLSNYPEYWEEVTTVLHSNDGYNLTKDDEYFVVNSKFKILNGGRSVKYPAFTRNKTKYLIFKSEANAKQYILYNKPLFSLKYIVNNLPTDEQDNEEFLESLTKQARDETGIL